ncbi:predicted protein [Uncinocarpus reesii 1704]|uniref:Uncharacterized protein n=1 Tax=Uncinocarpus reesii (strain UAMH 1704) TaxID=336963 RepID=C4JUB3_UNCRE|nr:uncharacterized protein UREG_06052 [Uncinocarpus reesii 1704]EEP81210.1 predicted protein [Uncinocarpus reesii 1704]
MSRIRSPAENPEELILSCPTIKADVYTTGRGGSGNMVSNDDPEATRARQDVDVPPSVTAGTADEGRFHTGRGGAANVYTRSPGDIVNSEDDPDTHALVEKTKSHAGSFQHNNTGSSPERKETNSQDDMPQKPGIAHYFMPGNLQQRRSRSGSKQHDPS